MVVNPLPASQIPNGRKARRLALQIAFDNQFVVVQSDYPVAADKLVGDLPKGGGIGGAAEIFGTLLIATRRHKSLLRRKICTSPRGFPGWLTR